MYVGNDNFDDADDASICPKNNTINLSKKEIREWLSNITRKRIIIDKHPRLRARKRLSDSSEETLYEYLMERRYKKIEKKIRYGVQRFELYYDHKDKSVKDDIVIVIIPCDPALKSIKVITIIT